MYKGFDFQQLGGMPLNQQRLEWMQEAYAGLSGALAGMAGDNVIVSGCVAVGSNVSDGWIVCRGELLPFVGSQTGVLDTFLIRETRTPLTFKDGTQKNVQFSRYAQFGTSGDAIPWNSLTRLPSLKGISADLSGHIANKSNPHGVTKTQVGLSNIPNSITADPTSNSAAVIASTAMVHSAIGNIHQKITVYKQPLSLTASQVFFAIGKTITPRDYQVLARIVEDGSLDIGNGVRAIQNAITSVALATVPGTMGTVIEVKYDRTKLSTTNGCFLYCSLIHI
jgi:hypothetical protein